MAEEKMPKRDGGREGVRQKNVVNIKFSKPECSTFGFLPAVQGLLPGRMHHRLESCACDKRQPIGLPVQPEAIPCYLDFSVESKAVNKPEFGGSLK
jgi:hypothetical protein